MFFYITSKIQSTFSSWLQNMTTTNELSNKIVHHHYVTIPLRTNLGQHVTRIFMCQPRVNNTKKCKVRDSQKQLYMSCLCYDLFWTNIKKRKAIMDVPPKAPDIYLRHLWDSSLASIFELLAQNNRWVANRLLNDLPSELNLNGVPSRYS